MDITLLSKMIGELLLDREEVGLPGLGAFLAEMVPASFSDKGYTINPPYRRVTFLPSRSEDDSLVELYSRSNNIDYDQAKAILQHFLEETKKELLEKKMVVFPGLGRLRSTRQNNFFFITDEDLDIFPDGFGLHVHRAGDMALGVVLRVPKINEHGVCRASEHRQSRCSAIESLQAVFRWRHQFAVKWHFQV